MCRSELDLGDKQGSWVFVTSKGIGTLLHLVIFVVTVKCLLIWVKIHLWSILVSQVIGITQVSIDLLIHGEGVAPPSKLLRPSGGAFSFQTNCFFCANPIVLAEKIQTDVTA